MKTKEKIIKDSSVLSLGLGISEIINFLKGVLFAGILGPFSFGIWKFTQVVFNYVEYANLGTLSSLYRQIPIYLGQGRIEEQKITQNVGFTNLIFASIVSGFIIIILRWWGLDFHGLFDFQFFLLSFAFFLTYQFYEFFQITLKCKHEFFILAKVQIIVAISSIIFGIILAKMWGVKGVILSFILGWLIGIACVQYWKFNKVSLILNIPKTKELVNIGFPISLNSFAFTFLWSIDLLMISRFLGGTQLGYYGIAFLFFTGLNLGCSALSQVLYPRLGEIYGRLNQNLAQMRNYVETPIIFLSILTMVMVGATYLLFPPFIQFFLPQYSSAIPVAKILVLAMFFLNLRFITGIFLNVAKKQGVYLLLHIGATILKIGLCYYFLQTGQGLIGVAWGTAISYFFFGMTMVIVSLYLIDKELLRPIGFLTKMLVIFIICLFPLLLFDFIGSLAPNYLVIQFLEKILIAIVFSLFTILIYDKFYPEADIAGEIKAAIKLFLAGTVF
jgi:O-antigen/teichoic acid export membrane protein